MKVLVEVSERLYKSALAYNFDMLDGVEAMKALKEGTIVKPLKSFIDTSEMKESNSESS